MGYGEVRSRLSEYRKAHEDALIGTERPKWFASLFGTVQAMLAAFSSDSENVKVSSTYATGKAAEREAAHMKLDYVCAMRRDARRQYASGRDGIYTDVTPFRHGAFSAHGADLFDGLMDKVLTQGGKQ